MTEPIKLGKVASASGSAVSGAGGVGTATLLMSYFPTIDPILAGVIGTAIIPLGDIVGKWAQEQDQSNLVWRILGALG